MAHQYKTIILDSHSQSQVMHISDLSKSRTWPHYLRFHSKQNKSVTAENHLRIRSET